MDNVKKEMKQYNTRVCPGEDSEAMLSACSILQQGGLVAFPTETVYGLGADALNETAAARIYAAKGRPSDNPLIVHIAEISDVDQLATTIPEQAKILMEAFWPGPLTIILPKKDCVPDGTTGGLPTVAIRMPSHPVARTLIKESGVFIAAPSANTSGRPSPTTAEHVFEDMNGKIEMILDGGAVGIGIESTIVDLTGEVPTILRPGFITKKMLEQLVGEVAIDPALIEADPSLRPKAPGMKYTHYAPHGELTIVEARETEAVITKINVLVAEKEAAGYTVAVLATKETACLYQCKHVLTVGEAARGETISANLYAVLRECDTIGADYMYSESLDHNELGGAIMNRLIKAAGHRVINADE